MKESKSAADAEGDTAGEGRIKRISKRKRGKGYILPYVAMFLIPLLAVATIVVIFVIAPFSDKRGVSADASPSDGAVSTPVESETPVGLETPATTKPPVRTPAPTPTVDPYEVRYLTAEEIEEALERNSYQGESERKLVAAAVSLVGKVKYFWGGKSFSIGPDPEWGKPHRVISEGHDTSGTDQPYGLDCSGYVNWCFIQLHSELEREPEEIMLLIGDGTWNQWNNSVPVEKKDVRIGDLAFINSYPGRDGNHVGICVGFDDDGQPLIAQCSYTMNNVVVSTCGHDFKYFRRPPVDITNL